MLVRKLTLAAAVLTGLFWSAGKADAQVIVGGSQGVVVYPAGYSQSYYNPYGGVYSNGVIYSSATAPASRWYNPSTWNSGYSGYSYPYSTYSGSYYSPYSNSYYNNPFNSGYTNYYNNGYRGMGARRWRW